VGKFKRRNHRQANFLGRYDPAVPGDDLILIAYQHRIGEAKVIGAFAMAHANCPPKFSEERCAHLDRWFTTDDLGPTLSTVFIAVVGFYFGQAAVKEIANMIRTRK
jgi:hypothetical protein